MKKNKMMRAASVLMVATLLTTSVISGTFAKYVTSVNSFDQARVAVWGFKTTSINITGLFKNVYGSTVKSSGDNNDVIAPGTEGSASFSFKFDKPEAAPEVAYTLKVSTDGSRCDQGIIDNPNILWKLDQGTFGTWGQLLADIEALSGDASGTKEYAPGELPTAFNRTTNTHTVEWKWIFDDTATNKETTTANNDANDTVMGNNGSDLVNLKITITATQID